MNSRLRLNISANRSTILKNRFRITAHSSTTSSVIYAGLLVYILTINLTLTLNQLRLLLAACILANPRAVEVLKHNLQMLARVTEDSPALPLPLKSGRLFPLLKRAIPLFLSRTQRVTSQLVCFQIIPNSIHVLGDSTTRHIRLGGPHITMKREPTFTVEAIDPHKVIGYHKVWIHVGINSLKRYHCRNMTEVKHKFDIFMKKVNEIKSVNSNTKVIISPILPTAIPEHNSRVLYFNSLLFAQKRQWGLLGFDALCDSSGLLAQVYRRFRTDKIHLGFRGINLLTSKLRAEISLADGKSFAAVVKGCSAPRYS